MFLFGKGYLLYVFLVFQHEKSHHVSGNFRLQAINLIYFWRGGRNMFASREYFKTSSWIKFAYPPSKIISVTCKQFDYGKWMASPRSKLIYFFLLLKEILIKILANILIQISVTMPISYLISFITENHLISNNLLKFLMVLF